MADDRLYCPLLAAGHTANSETSGDSDEHGTHCMLDECAWYAEKGCAVKALADIKVVSPEPAAS